MGADYPFGIIANAYDLPTYDGQPDSHKKYIERLKAFTKEDPPSSWPIMMYVGMQFLVEGIKKAGAPTATRSRRRSKGLTIDTPFGKQTHARQGPAGRPRRVLRQDGQGPEDGVAVMKDATYIDPNPFMD